MPKYSLNKNPKDYPNIQYGIMPLNCSQEHPALYQDASYPSHKKRLRKQRNL